MPVSGIADPVVTGFGGSVLRMCGLNLQNGGDADAYTPWQPADDWTLLVGQHVEVHSNGRIIDRGEVEAATADGRIMWLALEGASPRRLIEKLPGTHLRVAAGGHLSTADVSRSGQFS